MTDSATHTIELGPVVENAVILFPHLFLHSSVPNGWVRHWLVWSQITYQSFTGLIITNLSWPHLSLHPGPSHSFLLSCPLFCSITNWPDFACMSMPFWHPSWTSSSPRMKRQVTFIQQHLITPQNIRFTNYNAVKTTTPMYLHFESKGFFCFFFFFFFW
jgi:hypothetical protein